ncbi:sulfotransferase family protein [Paraburkholderia terricola]|uniref:sulfotransferase family protein n=1 Tax=Paraburkholderia terricola TaxID=169427 RepID=UPI0011779C59|nr:hypothetical protein [Paraburkholderia terricola]
MFGHKKPYDGTREPKVNIAKLAVFGHDMSSGLTNIAHAGRGRTILTVLGARSGTSALAGTLGILGCALPKTLMPANWANTKGYFEPEDIAALHDQILASVGSTWSDWREFPSGWFGSKDAERRRDDLASVFLQNYGEAALAVLKEPRMCRMLPLWDRVYKKLEANPVFCFIDRNPLEVAASLQARDGSSMEQGLLYYIRNHLDAELATRSAVRVFVSYDALLTDWRTTIKFVSEVLGVTFQTSEKQCSEVDSFLERDLRHQRHDFSRLTEDAVHDMAAAVHEAFTQLSHDRFDSHATNRLDELRAAFNARQS